MLTPLGKQIAYLAGKSMHFIRLREPWTAGLNAETGALVYARKFHKPTGVDQQSVALKVSLLPQDLGWPGADAPTISEWPSPTLAVLVNGRKLLAPIQSTEEPSGGALHFQLSELQAFNSLELHISRLNDITPRFGPIFDASSIPIFGSFVVKSVELQIE